jgi:hypothetical protein
LGEGGWEGGRRGRQERERERVAGDENQQSRAVYALGGNPPKRVPLVKFDFEAVMLPFNARQLRIPYDFLPAAPIAAAAAAAAADSLTHHSTKNLSKAALVAYTQGLHKTIKPPGGTPEVATSWSWLVPAKKRPSTFPTTDQRQPQAPGQKSRERLFRSDRRGRRAVNDHHPTRNWHQRTPHSPSAAIFFAVETIQHPPCHWARLA